MPDINGRCLTTAIAIKLIPNIARMTNQVGAQFCIKKYSFDDIIRNRGFPQTGHYPE